MNRATRATLRGTDAAGGRPDARREASLSMNRTRSGVSEGPSASISRSLFASLLLLVVGCGSGEIVSDSGLSAAGSAGAPNAGHGGSAGGGDLGTSGSAGAPGGSGGSAGGGSGGAGAAAAGAGGSAGSSAGSSGAAGQTGTPGECVVGTTDCDAGVPRSCDAQGSWQSLPACGGATPVCLGGACVVCTPKEVRCDPGGSPAGVQACENGTWGDAVACGPGLVCGNGVCRGKSVAGGFRVLGTPGGGASFRLRDGEVRESSTLCEKAMCVKGGFR
jgi:hypothetical protein